jgi:hypothetical protein
MGRQDDRAVYFLGQVVQQLDKPTGLASGVFIAAEQIMQGIKLNQLKAIFEAMSKD